MKEESPRFLEGYVCISSRGPPLPLDLELYSRAAQNAITWIEVNAADNFVRDPVNMNKIEVPRMLLINRLYGRLHYRGKPVVL